MASKKSRDVYRRVEVISKMTKEIGDMGVPATFIIIYIITPWTGRIYMAESPVS